MYGHGFSIWGMCVPDDVGGTIRIVPAAAASAPDDSAYVDCVVEMFSGRCAGSAGDTDIEDGSAAEALALFCVWCCTMV